jgi:hypothetical protein
MLFLALAVPAVYAYAASQGEIAKPRWLDDISIAINHSLPAQPQAEIPSVDPIAAAKVDEDLDYRIAERTNSIEGWRAFLTAHPDGSHAQSARAEFDKLAPPMTPSAPTAAQASNTGAADAKIPSGNVPPPLPSSGSDTATLASDETCRGDEDRLQRLSNSPTSDGIIRLLIELRCEKLRPQLLSLAKRLDTVPAAPADAAQDASSNPPSTQGASKDASIQAAKSRTLGSQHRARAGVASHSSEPRRHANHEKAASLPPFLLALFGDGPKNSTGVRRTRTGGGGH